MKCWYLIDTTCNRPPGKCEGCEIFSKWKKESDELIDSFYNEEMKKDADPIGSHNSEEMPRENIINSLTLCELTDKDNRPHTKVTR